MTIILLNLGSISKSCVAMMSVWDKDSIKFIIFWVLLISSAVVGSSNIQNRPKVLIAISLNLDVELPHLINYDRLT